MHVICFPIILSPHQDLIDEWIAKEAKRSNSNKTMDPSCLKWTPPKGT